MMKKKKTHAREFWMMNSIRERNMLGGREDCSIAKWRAVFPSTVRSGSSVLSRGEVRSNPSAWT